MARKAAKQTIGHTQVETNINTPGLVVAARPAHFAAPNFRVDQQKVQNLQNIARGYAGFVPVIRQIDQRVRKEQADKDAVRGARDRHVNANITMEDYPRFLEGQSEDYSRGFMGASGRRDAYSKVLAFEEYVKDNGDQILTEEQYNTQLANFIADDLKGMEDESYLAEYLGVTDQYEGRLKSDWQRDQHLKYQNDAAVVLQQDLRMGLEMVGPEASLQDLHTAGRTMYDTAVTMGIPREIANKMYVEQMAQYAETYGRTDVFGEPDGTSMGLFEMGSASVEDPSKEIPGLANSPKWGPKLDDYKQRIKDASVQAKVEKDELLVMDRRDEISRLTEAGSTNQARALNRQSVDEGLWKGATGASLNDEITVQDRKIRQRKNDDLMYSAGVPIDDKSRRRDAADRYASRQFEGPGMDDIDKQAEARNRTRDMDARNATMNSITRQQLMASPAGDVNRYTAAANEFAVQRAINPNNLRNQIGADKYDEFVMYHDAVDAGMDGPDATAYVRQFNTPEMNAKVSDFKKTAAFEGMYDRLDSATNGAFNGMAESHDLVNMAVPYYMITGNMDTSIEKAVSIFEDTHHKVELPNGDDHWVDLRGMDIPPKWEEAQADFSKDTALRDKLGITDDDADLVWVNDPAYPASDHFLVLRTDTMTFVQEVDEDGIVRQMRVNPLKTTSEYVKGELEAQMMESPEAQAAHKANTERRAELAKERQQTRKLHDERSRYR